MASQQLSQDEVFTVQNRSILQGKVIASGSAFIFPQVDNNVTISLKLRKKELCNYPPSDFKLKIKSPGKFREQDMNSFVKAMGVFGHENFNEVLFWGRVPNIMVGDELTFELVDQVPFPGNFLDCLDSSVEVVPVNSN